PNLTSLTIGLKPPHIDNLFKNCPNLYALDLRILQDRHIETNLAFLKHLANLSTFRLTCRWLRSQHLLLNLSKCGGMLDLELNAKRFNYFDEAAYFQDLWRLSDLDYNFQCTFGQDDTADRTVSGPHFQTFEFQLRSVKLSLDNVVTSTKVANLLLMRCQRLKTIKLMKKLMKIRYNYEHMVIDDRFCRDYYANVYLENTRSLNVLCLPCLDLVSEDAATLNIRQFLRSHPLNKLYVYGGSLFSPDSTKDLTIHKNLTSLYIGPYLRSFSGLDRVISSLPNLKRLSFHGQSNGGMNGVLFEIGCHRLLEKVVIRNLTNYFVEKIDVEILPIIGGRSRLERSGTLYESLSIDGHVRARHHQLPIFVENQLQALKIKFKFIYI
uniref:Uncharacterized protein n=1 Tax=Romanomermis culicivorax TaxID=13658 RepID=A0A915IW87_ROMCU